MIDAAAQYAAPPHLEVFPEPSLILRRSGKTTDEGKSGKTSVA